MLFTQHVSEFRPRAEYGAVILVGGKMAAWSRIFRPVTTLFTRSKDNCWKIVPNNVTIRWMSGHDRTIKIRPSRWQWLKAKDLFHFYFMLGVIPWTIVLTYVNVFIGPATLEPTPEGYEPKWWEYERHPVSRWLAKHVVNSPQQEYEKNLASLYLKNEARKLRKLEAQVQKYMSDYQDYQAFYYRHHFGAKYIHDYRMHLDKLAYYEL